MKREKKFCFCFTAGRVVGAILLMASLGNLIIVRAVVEAGSPEGPAATQSLISASPEIDPGLYMTLTLVVPTATQMEMPTSTLTDTASPTMSVTATQTTTATPTVTSTSSAIPTLCVFRSYWPYLYVQSGETLYRLADATGSTVDELMQANCLTDFIIYPGQLLYVPRLPSPTVTPSATSVPTVFMEPNGEFSTCDSLRVNFSVLPYDPERIVSVRVFYTRGDNSWIAMAMQPDGNTYYGSGSLPAGYAGVETVYYYFSAQDGLGNSASSPEYKVDSSRCPVD